MSGSNSESITTMGDEDKIEPIEEPTPVLRVEHVPGLISLSKEDLEAFDEKMESQSTTLRGSFADTNFSNRPPLARSSNGRTLSELFAESRPETPFGPSSPPWIDNERFSSTSLPSYATNTPMRSTEALGPLIQNSGYADRDWVKEGFIEQLNGRDDHDHLPTWKRYLYYLSPLLAASTLGAYWLYFILRILFVISAQKKQHRSFPMAWAFIGIEVSVALPTFLQLFWAMFIWKRRKRPQLRLISDDLPSIDVLITCCNEGVELVLDTVHASCEIDYPQDRFRVLVLDDGASSELRKAINVLRDRYANLYYRSREKFPGVPHHFKAGNLNYGVQETQFLPGGPANFIAALDADMIPEKHWLRAVMPHLLMNPNLALACPPQLFYNIPRGDPLCQSLDFFVHVSEPIKDALGVAWCTGSGYIVRRDALGEIGYFPQGSLAEDVAMSTLLLGRGWKTAFIHEPLQFGTVPDSFDGHLKQRTRWAIGTVDTAIKLKFCLWGDSIGRMTFFQRMSGFIYAILSLYNIFLLVSLFALPIVLISGHTLIAYANDTQLKWLIRACFGALLTNRIGELALFIPAGYATGQRGSRAQLWMAPYITITIIRSFFLPKWLGGQTQSFKPSGSIKSELNERDPKHRAGLFRRLRVILLSCLAIFHVAYVYFCLSAVSLSTSRCVADNGTVRERLECLLTHAFWPPIAWILVVSSFWVPITYAIDPPSCPPREELLEREDKTGVKRPKDSAKRIAFRPSEALFEIEYCLTTAFTALVFAAAFFYL